MKQVDIQQAYDKVSNDLVLLRTDYTNIKAHYDKALVALNKFYQHKYNSEQMVIKERERIVNIIKEFSDYNRDWFTTRYELIKLIQQQ